MIALFGPEHLPGPLATPAGLWLLFGAPTAFWFGLGRRLVSTGDAALLVAVGLALMTDFAVMLSVNYIPPVFGHEHPLTRIPIAAGFAVADILIGAFSPEAPPPASRRLPEGLRPTLVLGGLCLVLAVAGPTRMNNGLGPHVSMLGYVAVFGLLLLLLVRNKTYSITAIQTGIFCAAAAMLLLTSLRGWLLTGHDVQTEYEYFRLSYGGERWEIALYPGAYNACLSITMLPLAVVHLTTFSGIGVFKIVLPLLFAVAPVALFRATHNVAPRLVALLSAFFFLTFPTFFTDMPYLGRQEVAFVLLGAAIVLATDPGRSLLGRRLVFMVFLGGIVQAHYSTSYVLLMVLGGAVGVDLVWRLGSVLRRAGRNPDTGADPAPNRRATSFVTAWMVVAAAGAALVWAGPVTHTSGQLATTMKSVLQEIQGKSKTVGSNDTSSSLFGGEQMSDAERLARYRSESVASTANARAIGVFQPLSVLDQYPTPSVAEPDLPLSKVGRQLDKLGVPVAAANRLSRSAIAAGMQVLILLGLVVTVFVRRARGRLFTPSRDQIVLTVGSLGMLAALTVVPQLSVDYGVLRAFQQGIFFFGPFMAAGLLWTLSLVRAARTPVIGAVMGVIMLDLTGVVPQTTGGYPAQLTLNNTGRYYDLYYPTPATQDAALWLQLQMSQPHPPAHAVQTSRFTFNGIQTIYTRPARGTIFPTIVSADDYVLLGPSVVDKGQDTINYRGTLVTYKYPTAMLDAVKNKVYAGDGVEVYR